MAEFVLTGPRGDNPLGFLTALGALATLEDAGQPARLGWQRLAPRLVVEERPDAGIPAITNREDLVRMLHRALRRSAGALASETDSARRDMELARTAAKKKAEEIKRRKLDREAAREARQRELQPLQRQVLERTQRFRELLMRSAPDPAVTLGKNLTAPNAELLEHVRDVRDRCGSLGRRPVDLAAAFGVANPARPLDRMLSSPWALVSGGGHQDFLASVQALMIECTEKHIEQALFGPWEPRDERYSLRLDAGEDRRYALMDRDPTASGNKPLTLWGANRLAFEALRFFPCVPAREGMAVLAWRAGSANWQESCRVRWPLWDEPIRPDVLRSLLGLPDIWLDANPISRLRLRGLGIRAVMESTRIASGEGANKRYNLTPAWPVWG